MRAFLVSVFVLLSVPVFCQFAVKGKVVAADTRSPLAAASVFLSNTSAGTVTNASGEFTLPVPAGKYDLVISFVGYQTFTQPVSNGADSTLTIVLQPKVEIFDEVVVGGYEKDGWQKWGRFFVENFIGTSEWAADCSIKNYDVLKFRHSKKENRLSVVATGQLVIENKALGYTVRYQLEDFVYDFTNSYILYVGYPLFTEMEGGPAKQKRWNSRRQEVYYGSVMEFMRAVYRNRIKEEGYEVRRLVKTPNEEKARVKALYRNYRLSMNGRKAKDPGTFSDSSDYYNQILEQPDEFSRFSPYTISGDSIAYAIDSITAGLDFDNYLHIIYKKASPPESYRRLSRNNTRMMSQLTFAYRQPVHIESNGHFYPPLNLMSSGYWAWSEKMATMLPFDYRPPLHKE